MLLLTSGVSAKSPSVVLGPRFLPREQLNTLSLVLRGSLGEQSKAVANATITNNSTQPNITQANAGWTAVTQGTDKQYVVPVLWIEIKYLNSPFQNTGLITF